MASRSFRRVLVGAVVLMLAAGALVWAWFNDGPPTGETVSGSTVFGTTVARRPGETRPEALARINAAYGPVPLVRVYAHGLPPTWRELHRDLGDVAVVVSFKVEPSRLLSGSVDDRLRAWFAHAPTDRDTYWVYFHEPEDDVAAGRFSAEEFRRAWEHVALLAAQESNDRLHSTVVLMCYTLKPASGRDWRDYVPRPDLVDVLAWDCYGHGTADGMYTTPEALLGRAVEVARDLGVAWGVAELGARLVDGDDGSGRAEWLTTVARYAADHDARFVTYFDSTVGGDFRLTDPPSMQAWQQVITG